MKLDVTVMKEDDRCVFYVDDFTDKKFTMTGNPLTFYRRAHFTQDSGEPTFTLPLEDAKEMAREILKLGD